MCYRLSDLINTCDWLVWSASRLCCPLLDSITNFTLINWRIIHTDRSFINKISMCVSQGYEEQMVNTGWPLMDPTGPCWSHWNQSRAEYGDEDQRGALSLSPPPVGGALLPPLGLSLMLVAAADWSSWSEYTMISSSSLHSRASVLLLLLLHSLFVDEGQLKLTVSARCLVCRHRAASDRWVRIFVAGKQREEKLRTKLRSKICRIKRSGEECESLRPTSQVHSVWTGPSDARSLCSTFLCGSRPDTAEHSSTSRTSSDHYISISFTHEGPDSWSIAQVGHDRTRWLPVTKSKSMDPLIWILIMINFKLQLRVIIVTSAL